MAIQLANDNVNAGGGPFGAVIVRDGAVIATGANHVTQDNDPTAHAEVVAIREACQKLASFSLAGCEIYASCEPCPMCLSAIYWARVDAVWFAADHNDAAAAGFDDAKIYRELSLPPEARSLSCNRLDMEEAKENFRVWLNLPGRVAY